jgi:hypothetical protein
MIFGMRNEVGALRPSLDRLRPVEEVTWETRPQFVHELIRDGIEI